MGWQFATKKDDQVKNQASTNQTQDCWCYMKKNDIFYIETFYTIFYNSTIYKIVYKIIYKSNYIIYNIYKSIKIQFNLQFIYLISIINYYYTIIIYTIHLYIIKSIQTLYKLHEMKPSSTQNEIKTKYEHWLRKEKKIEERLSLPESQS